MNDKQTYGYPRPASGELMGSARKSDWHSIPGVFNQAQIAQLFGRLERIEAKLDMLVKALAEEDEGPTHTLDGELIPADRVEGEEL